LNGKRLVVHALDGLLGSSLPTWQDVTGLNCK
jgi:hypothetical protein